MKRNDIKNMIATALLKVEKYCEHFLRKKRTQERTLVRLSLFEARIGHNTACRVHFDN